MTLLLMDSATPDGDTAQAASQEGKIARAGFSP
jgi:hypothetical protein